MLGAFTEMNPERVERIYGEQREDGWRTERREVESWRERKQRERRENGESRENRENRFTEEIPSESYQALPETPPRKEMEEGEKTGKASKKGRLLQQLILWFCF